MSLLSSSMSSRPALSRRCRVFLAVHYSAIAALIAWIGFLFLQH